jgi:hypothetical protein
MTPCAAPAARYHDGSAGIFLSGHLEISRMRKVLFATSLVAFAAAPALAMDGDCNWGAKQLNAKATPTEATRSASIEATTVGDKVKADEIVTAEAARAEDTRKQ